MLYLYLGYVVTQLYAIADVFTKNTVAPSAIFFSLVVFAVWSFIPVLGYFFAKMLGAPGHKSKMVLLVMGITIALIENGFTYFNILTDKQFNIGTALVLLLFFLIAYLPLNRQTSTNR
jgi:hypothetical protein